MEFAFGVLCVISLQSVVQSTTTNAPSSAPTSLPTGIPTLQPTAAPMTPAPTTSSTSSSSSSNSNSATSIPTSVPTLAPTFRPTISDADTIYTNETEYLQEFYRFFAPPGGTFSHAVQACEAQGSGWHVAYPTLTNREFFKSDNVSKSGFAPTLGGDGLGVAVMWMGAMRTSVSTSFRYIVGNDTLGASVSEFQGFWTYTYDAGDAAKNCVEYNEWAGSFSNAPCDDIKRFACTNSSYLTAAPTMVDQRTPTPPTPSPSSSGVLAPLTWLIAIISMAALVSV